MKWSLMVVVLVSVTFNATAQVLLRKAVMGAPIDRSSTIERVLPLLSSVYLWLGLFSFAASLGLWLIVLSKLPVGVAYPMASLGYVVAAILGMATLGEPLSLFRCLGISVICLGVFLVARTA